MRPFDLPRRRPERAGERQWPRSHFRIRACPYKPSDFHAAHYFLALVTPHHSAIISAVAKTDR